MLKGRSSRPARAWKLLALVAVLGLMLALATDGAGASGGPYAQVAKKCKKHRFASSAKKCKKKHAVMPVAPAPSPQPLTNQEILGRVTSKALEYAQQDPDFDGSYGYISDDMAGTIPHCSSKSALSATCEGWYEGDDGVDVFECDFYEVVERDGLTGIKSHLDTTFGTNGFDCFLI